ncbi:Proline dehydrogenase 1, mitochondrial [Sphaceloma murrayae]|uniref:Proline dehydrogenase n=1 Tax=Sphaceloma murrayae TaxID=2082308 RepID=A0A2K1QL62_9PEZI|nr:Proline dehydrogenase 1, mitochondrial [Sphaceloma murrayae]
MKQLESIGYHGVVLEYALEVLKDTKGADEASDVRVWRQGLLDSIDMARPGDMVAFKWSGLGSAAFKRLEAGDEPSPLHISAMREICDAASAKTVYLLPSAEENATLPAYHQWTLNMQRIYNRGPAGSIIYNTYQAYLRGMPNDLNQHLADAQKGGYNLGVKLVRGAYMGSEAKHLICGSAQETHDQYDATTAALLRNRYEGPLYPIATANRFPKVSVILATHNLASTRKAQAIVKQRLQDNEPMVPLVYAQLQGMADEISCELLAAGHGGTADAPRVVKYTSWGTMKQCLNYLLRRAGENKDAAGRTAESRNAMGKELGRRFRSVFGFA